MKFLISENQCAFIPRRLTTENALLAHEQIRNFNQGNKNKICIKVDLHKAFDKINMHFILYMLKPLGFDSKFHSLNGECTNNETYSILINGSTSGFNHSNRGIRQGDPLSSYLLSTAMKFLSS